MKLSKIFQKYSRDRKCLATKNRHQHVTDNVSIMFHYYSCTLYFVEESIYMDMYFVLFLFFFFPPLATEGKLEFRVL